MAWTSPFTATAGAVYTAAQHNTNTRDNLNQTGPALVSAVGQILVSTAANALAARTPAQAYIAANEGSSSTAYGSITTFGPVVTVATGTQAFVGIYCSSVNIVNASAALMAYSVTGASTITVSDDRSIGVNAAVNTGLRCGAVFLQTGLTPGSNQFTAQYRVGSGTGNWQDRRLFVIPL